MGDLDTRLYDLGQVVNKLNTTVLLNAKEQEHLADAVKGLSNAVDKLNTKIDGKITDMERRLSALENMKIAGRWFLIGVGFFIFAIASSAKDAFLFVQKLLAGG